MSITIRNKNASDRKWIIEVCKNNWGSEKIISRGTIYNLPDFPGIIAQINNADEGFLIYNKSNSSCEILSVISLKRGQGIGTRLLDELIKRMTNLNCVKITLVTTNDNTNTLRFYQTRGFVIKAVYQDIIKSYRRIKTEIPELGLYNIPIRDEIELELLLQTSKKYRNSKSGR